jgi:N-acetyl-1-D-myo-inositol-2-amino-2-deoxy-alpha-D-glucopyranoside deacetylase
MNRKPVLLAVFAHPDDEAFSSGGTLTHYARRGVDVHLLCSTRGEAGKVTDPSLGEVTDLAAQREAELRDACAVMGIHPPIFMGYRDSGRLERLRRDDPLASINIAPLEVEERVRAEIAHLQPDVMLSFDPHGGYGHPDHLVIHRAALEAFYSSGHLAHPPKRLFFTAFPMEMARQMFSGNASPTPGLDPELYGVSLDTIAVQMQIGAYREQKLAAIAAHRTQTGANSRMNQLPADQREAMMTRMVDVEHFALGATRASPIARWPLNGFFDGLGFENLE